WKSRTCCKVRRGFKSRPLRSRLQSPAAKPPARGRKRASVVDAGEQFHSAQHFLRSTAEPDVVAGVLREEDFVARNDALDLGADGGDDAGAALGFGARWEDQARPRLGLLVGRLDDDIVVQRLEREAKRARVLQHASTILLRSAVAIAIRRAR